MVTCTGHIGIHEGANGRTDVDDVMAIKPNFLTSMGYHIFLTMALRACPPSARAELRYYNTGMIHMESRNRKLIMYFTNEYVTKIIMKMKIQAITRMRMIGRVESVTKYVGSRGNIFFALANALVFLPQDVQ